MVNGVGVHLSVVAVALRVLTYGEVIRRGSDEAVYVGDAYSD